MFYNESGTPPDEAEPLRGIQCLYVKREENPETCPYNGRGSVVQLLQGGTVSQSYSYNAYGYINADEYGIQTPFYGYNGEQIVSTPNHPYYVEGKGWVEASALHEGQTVWLANGTKTTVEAVSNQTLQESVAVYNIEVADFHTYFVGDCGVLVHNCNSNSPTDPTQGVTIHLKIKDGWSQDQINAAINKADALTNGNTYVVDPATIQRDSSAIRAFQSLYGKMKGYDVDHIIELQVGGDNSLSNLQFLDSSVNRSFGAQIKIQIADLYLGTLLGKFVIDNLPS